MNALSEPNVVFTSKGDCSISFLIFLTRSSAIYQSQRVDYDSYELRDPILIDQRFVLIWP